MDLHHLLLAGLPALLRITPDRVGVSTPWAQVDLARWKAGDFPFYRFHLAARSRYWATASEFLTFTHAARSGTSRMRNVASRQHPSEIKNNPKTQWQIRTIRHGPTTFSP